MITGFRIFVIVGNSPQPATGIMSQQPRTRATKAYCQRLMYFGNHNISRHKGLWFDPDVDIRSDQKQQQHMLLDDGAVHFSGTHTSRQTVSVRKISIISFLGRSASSITHILGTICVQDKKMSKNSQMWFHVTTQILIQISGSEQDSAASQDLRKLAPKALLTVNFQVHFSQFQHAYTTNNKQYDH